MLLFFQIGNEWTLAAWLPFCLIHGMGASPNTAMLLLAIHFVFLLVGRWLAKSLLTVVPHRRFLMTGVALSIVGYVLLATARNVEIATTAVIVIALALGPVFPVAAENLDRELSSSVDRILVSALSGAAVGPCLAGFLCHGFGVAQVMIIPALGSVIVCVIALLIMLEAQLMGAVD